MKKLNIRTITTLGLLVAVEIVLARFCSISAWNIRIGFSFLPIVIAAVMFGPLQAGIVAALGDFIGAIMFPLGMYFPGLTLTAFLTGIVFGLFLHKRQNTIRIFGAVAVNQLVLSLVLNTLWISILYNSPYQALFATRTVQCLILCPVQYIMIGLTAKSLQRYGKKAIA